MGTWSVRSATHPGKVRPLNEDAVLLEPDLGLIAIADGMGGHNAGDVASRLALESVQRFMRLSAESQDFTWPCGINPALSWNRNRLLAAITIANRFVLKASEQQSAYAGMGTTIVAALVHDHILAFSSVGDSRIYQLTASGIQQLSRDDSWVGMLAAQSGTNVLSFRDHPMRNVLTRVVGSRPDLEIPTTEVVMRDGDLVLLSTDGLHGALTDEEIAALLSGHGEDLQRAADALLIAAVDRDGSDNVSLILARYSEQEPRPAA